MDSVTQAVLGASVAGISAPAGSRRKALLLGAALGTLPDLDFLIDFGDAVKNYTYHRGFSHSLFVLVPFASVLWLALRRWWAPVSAAPGRWLAAILLALVTHPLLDAHTSYGTQLWWPLTSPPATWSTVFIIDPLYTLPLLVAVLAVLIKPSARRAGAWLAAGLLISSGYLAWSWTGKMIVEDHARAVLRKTGIEPVSLFSVPTPFNTLLWRVVVLTEDGYLEGLDSLVADDGPIRFSTHVSNEKSLDAASNVWAVKRLRWFTQDLLIADIEDGVLVLSDLRMGQEPYYVFRHAVARRGNPRWLPIESRRIPTKIDTRLLLTELWERMWGRYE